MNVTKSMIKALLKEKAFVLYGQPKWTFGKNTCNTYEVFAEMILTADRGTMHAQEIMPMIEADEELTDLFGTWFLEAALQTGEQLKTMTGVKIVLSMNVLGFQVNHPESFDKIKRALDKSFFTPKYIQFELSEAQQLTNTGIENLTRMREELGIKLVLGNFGTGHSNFDILRLVKFDTIELDKSFVRRLPQNRQDVQLLVGILHFADTVGLSVCAKGVETAEQMEVLESIGVEKGQGYLIGKPMPIDELAEFIKKYAKK